LQVLTKLKFYVCFTHTALHRLYSRIRTKKRGEIDLQVLTKLTGAGKELNATIRQRLAILLADLAQLPSVQARFAELLVYAALSY
jgi:hypothetical protein